MASRVPVLAIAVATLLFAVACGRSDKPPTPPRPAATPSSTPAPSPTPTPVALDVEALLRDAGEATESLRTFKFSLTHQGGSTQLFPGLFIEDAKGAVVSPDKISVEFSGTFGTGFAVKSGLITLGRDSYILNPLTGDWEANETGVSPLGFFNPRVGIAGMMVQLERGLQIDSEEDLEDVYRLRGSLATEALAPLLGATLEGARVDVELTIDAKRHLLLTARVAGRATSTDADGIVRVITLSGFNEPITIEPPI